MMPFFINDEHHVSVLFMLHTILSVTCQNGYIVKQQINFAQYDLRTINWIYEFTQMFKYKQLFTQPALFVYIQPSSVL